ncbi:MAG: diacylglycerol kinase family protein [Acholeplasma sp.]|nr:diacylglycerol kinase family protein [Acholeplasma sp.]
MHLILYNPLSRNGKNVKLVFKLKSSLIREGKQVEVINILNIEDIEDFIYSHNHVSKIIIIGGDGTLNKLVNAIRGLEVKPEIYLSRAGTGNDFIRSLKVKKKKAFIDIKKYLENLPSVTFNDEEMLFLNGVGSGLDGHVCYLLNNSNNRKSKGNYFKNAIKAFREFKPLVSRVKIDDQEEMRIDKTWFVTVMNSKYFGGGMKIAPKADRESDYLNVVIIKKIPKWLLLLIFPTIYLGWHVIFNKYVEIYQANSVEVNFSRLTYLQIDGEDYQDVGSMKIYKKKNEKVEVELDEKAVLDVSETNDDVIDNDIEPIPESDDKLEEEIVSHKMENEENSTEVKDNNKDSELE